jgi:hypothetical protein
MDNHRLIKFITEEDAADLAGVPPAMLRAYRRAGRVLAREVGDALEYDLDSLLSLMDVHKARWDAEKRAAEKAELRRQARDRNRKFEGWSDQGH